MTSSDLFSFAIDVMRSQLAQVQQEPAAALPPFLLYANPRDRMAGIEAENVLEGHAHVNTRPQRKE